MFSLSDPAPLVSWSVLDHERRPKLAWETLKRACAPVIVVADRPPALVTPDESISLDVHVVNDLHKPIELAEVDIVARWAGGQRRWRFGGNVGADECVKVGNITFDIPHTLGGLTFDLTLTAGEITAINHYASVVTILPD